MFTVGDGCAKLSLAKRLSIRVLILRYGSLSLCLFAQLWVPAANLGVKIGGGGTFGPVDRKWTKMILGKDTLKRAT